MGVRKGGGGCNLGTQRGASAAEAAGEGSAAHRTESQLGLVMTGARAGVFEVGVWGVDGGVRGPAGFITQQQQS